MKKFITAILLVSLLGTSVFAQNITFGQDAFYSNQKIGYQWVKDVPGLPSLSGALPSQTKSNGHYAASSSSSFFAELFFDVLCTIWIYDLFVVTWDDYPYQDGKYVNFLDFETGVSAMLDDELPGTESSVVGARGKPYRYALDANLSYYPQDFMYQGEARVEGYIWKFFGPVFEFDSYAASIQDLPSTKDAYMNLKLGGQLSLLHTNFLSASCHFQWTHWLGLADSWSHTDGFNSGVILRSYPVKPVTIEWRFNVQEFGSSSSSLIFDSHLQVGVVLDSPLEIYGAWKFLENEITGQYVNGFTGGIRYNF